MVGHSTPTTGARPDRPRQRHRDTPGSSQPWAATRAELVAEFRRRLLVAVERCTGPTVTSAMSGRSPTERSRRVTGPTGGGCQCPKSSARLTCGLRGSCRRVWTSVCLCWCALMSTLFCTPVRDGESRGCRASYLRQTKTQVSQDTSHDDPTLAPPGSEHVQGTTDINADDFGH
jgi:hypothetical protein